MLEHPHGTGWFDVAARVGLLCHRQRVHHARQRFQPFRLQSAARMGLRSERAGMFQLSFEKTGFTIPTGKQEPHSNLSHAFAAGWSGRCHGTRIADGLGEIEETWRGKDT